MITLIIVTIIVLLIIINFSLSYINEKYPDYYTVRDYFQSAQMLPDGSLADLGTIPSSRTSRNYIGAEMVDTGDPGVIGLRSWNDENKDFMKNKKNMKGYEFSNKVDDIYKNRGQKESTTSRSYNTYGNKNMVIFNDEMSGLSGNINHAKIPKRKTNPTEQLLLQSTDGYHSLNDGKM